MQETTKIECPNCGSSIKLENNEYSQILSQISDKEIEKRVSKAVEIKEDAIEREHNQKIEHISTKHQQEIKFLEEKIENLTTFKLKQSTKYIGESLENYLLNKFKELQTMGAFLNATFKKDNKLVKRIKGDFIFTDYDEDGNEIVKVMIEAKNQGETGKKKNSDYFKTLNENKTNKNCDYSLLTSTLEPEIEIYNKGVIPIREYKNMHFSRPDQTFTFLSFISDLRKEVLKEKRVHNNNQIIDILNFEENLNEWQDSMNDNANKIIDYQLGILNDKKKQKTNLEAEIDKTEKLLNHLESLKKKATEMTTKRIANDSPGIKKIFKTLNEEVENEDKKRIQLKDINSFPT